MSEQKLIEPGSAFGDGVVFGLACQGDLGIRPVTRFTATLALLFAGLISVRQKGLELLSLLVQSGSRGVRIHDISSL